MKTLSVRQPWAEWILHGCETRFGGNPVKDVENRTWPTKYKGPLLIHASKTFDRMVGAQDLSFIREPVIPKPDDCIRGAIVGIVELIKCERNYPSPWYQGEWAWVLDNAEHFPPVPYKGRLGLFEVDWREFPPESRWTIEDWLKGRES